MGGSKGGDCLVSNTLEGSSSAAARNLEMTAFVFSTVLREFQTNIFREAAQAPATGKAPVAPATGSGADFPTWIAERDDVVVRASSDLTSPKVEVRCRTKPRRSQRCERETAAAADRGAPAATTAATAAAAAVAATTGVAATGCCSCSC